MLLLRQLQKGPLPLLLEVLQEWKLAALPMALALMLQALRELLQLRPPLELQRKLLVQLQLEPVLPLRVLRLRLNILQV